MAEEFNIWDLNNKIMADAYKKDNYQIVDTGNKTGLCYIFFSSNGLYYPNTEEDFVEQVVKKDRYEWKWVVKNSKIPKLAERIIYVRDIFKMLYTRGINDRINTIDKMLDWLKEVTENYRVVTAGSSGGGYMAVLTAIKLNADYCINFSGPYWVGDLVETPYPDLAKLLKEYKGKVFYFFPIHYDFDSSNYERVKGLACIKPFMFNESKHASTMFGGNICYVIDLSEEALDFLYQKYENKQVNRYFFLLHTVPLFAIFKIARHELSGWWIRKQGKHDNGI